MPMDLEELAHISEEQLQAIRYFKLKEIQKAWDDLFAIGLVPVLYKRHPEYVDYKTFERGFREKFKAIWGRNQIELAKIDSEIEKVILDEEVSIGITLKGIGDNELEFFDKLLSFDYIPPNNLESISQHLLLMISYYSNGNIFIPFIEMRLDLSLCKLIGAVNRLFGAAKLEGETRLAGRKKQGKGVDSKQNEVFVAFQVLEIKNKPRYKGKSQIAKAIINYLVSKNKTKPKNEKIKIPSEKTVIRYMNSNEDVRRDLIEMGVIKDKPTLVQ